MRSSGLWQRLALLCALAAAPSVALSQPPASASAVAAVKQQPGKQAAGQVQEPVALSEYAGIYKFPKSPAMTVVAHDGKLYERMHDDGYSRIEQVGPDEFMVPEWRVYFTFRRSAGTISSVVVNHDDDFIGKKTDQPIPVHAFLGAADEKRYAGTYTLAANDDGADIPMELKALSGIRISVKNGSLVVQRPHQPDRQRRARAIYDRPDCFAYDATALCFEHGQSGRISGIRASLSTGYPEIRHERSHFLRREAYTEGP